MLKKLLFQADIVELGVEEAERILGTGCVEEIDDIILKNKEETVIAIKDGKNGAYAVNAECMVKIPPYSCTCIETIGAGDAFNAGFLSGILEKKELEICGRMGAIAGALTTEVKGDTEGQPDREKLEQVNMKIMKKIAIY